MTYPKSLYEWKIDEPDKELYIASILENGTVVSAYGRYGHSSGSTSVSWQEFLAGEMNDVVEKTMGKRVLDELLGKLNELNSEGEISKLSITFRVLAGFILFCGSIATVGLVFAFITEPFHPIIIISAVIVCIMLHVSANIVFKGFAPKYLRFAHGPK